jgi:Phosphoserine phosphatase RsbU, N-terminal domain
MRPVDDLTRDYRVAFLAYLPRREEAALHRGYELGRSAVAEGLSILELALIHHQVFLEILRESPSEELPEVAHAASEFFLDVLATFDMAQRVSRDGQEGVAQAPDPRPGNGITAPRPRARGATARAPRPVSSAGA